MLHLLGQYRVEQRRIKIRRQVDALFTLALAAAQVSDDQPGLFHQAVGFGEQRRAAVGQAIFRTAGATLLGDTIRVGQCQQGAKPARMIGVGNRLSRLASLAVGIRLPRIWALVWAVAGFVGLVAGLLWGARLGVQFSLSLVVLKALPVLIIGGFSSIGGAIVGGLIIGAAEKLAEIYLGPIIGSGIENWVPYVLALLFLLVRPAGLFGERAIERV